MSEVKQLSKDSLFSYPKLRKHVFRWVASLSEAEAYAMMPEIRRMQGRFLRSARLWRSMELEDIRKSNGISIDSLRDMESGSQPIIASDWMLVALTLNIQDDAEIFILLLEGAFNEQKRRARTDIAETMRRMGFRQLKSLEAFQPNRTSIPKNNVLLFSRN